MQLKHAAGQVFQDQARFRVLVAARRFGKTRMLLCELLRAAAAPNQSAWYIAPTYRQARQIMWACLKTEIPREYIIKCNETDLSMTLTSGSTISLRGADNPDSLRGVALDFAAFDEYDFIDPEVFPMVIRPTLLTTGGKAIFVGTPYGFGPLYDLYLRGQSKAPDDAEWSSYQFTTIEGGWVDRAEIEDARRDSDERTFKQEYLACFENATGRVYYAFDRAGNIKEPPANIAAGSLAAGMDFNVSPMTAVIIAEDVESTWIIDEIVIPNNSNTLEMIGEIRRRYGQRVSTVYPDPTGRHGSTNAPVGQSDHELLRQAGFRVLCRGVSDVRDGINAVNTRLCNAAGERRLFVSPKCVNLIEALERHAYKAGTSKPDKNDGYDHIVDGLRYGVEFLHPITKRQNWQQ